MVYLSPWVAGLIMGRHINKGFNSLPLIFLKIHLSDFSNHSRIETVEDVTYVCSNGPENIDP